MPVRIHLPTRIRGDAGSLTARHAAEIADALAAAAKRALGRARTGVQSRIHGITGICINEPTVCWCGDRSGEIGPADRAAIETALRAALARAIDAAGLSAEAARWGVSHRPAEVSERFDPVRYDRMRGSYLIDSYAGGEEQVSVVSFEPDTVTAGAVQVAKLVTETVDEDVLAELEVLRERASPARPLGVIYRVQSGGAPWYWQVAITDGGPDLMGLQFEASSFSRWEFMGAKASPMFKKQQVIPSPGPGNAEIIIRAADPAAFRTAFLAEMKAESTARIQHISTPVSLTTARFRELAAADIERSISNELAGQPQPPVLGIRVRLSGASAVVCVGAGDAGALKWNGKAELTTITESKSPTKSEKHEGKTGAERREGGAVSDGQEGGTGKCPPDDRPDDHPPDDVEESLDDLPFLGEPSLDEIGDIGERLRDRIAELAARLHIRECPYAGQFCYHAAAALLDGAIETQWMTETATGENAPSRAQQANMGVLDFTPASSPIIARIREVARSVQRVSELLDYITSLFEEQSYACTIHGIWRGEGTSWALRLREAVVPVMKDAVIQLFIGACRSMLLQLLGTSLKEILKRQNAMPRYALLFERWIVPMIADMAELEQMRLMLRNHEIARVAAPAIEILGSKESWVGATGALVLSLRGNPFAQAPGEPYSIIDDNGIPKIRDRKGRLWSKEDLESALSLRGQLAEGADPLVKQIVDTEDARKRFKDTNSVREELGRLLAEMVQNNKEIAGKADEEPVYAFRTGQISEDIPSASIEGGKYALQGIHKLAHEQIGDAFGGSWLYAAGVDDLFDAEEGRRTIKAVALTGILLLCVLVPGGAIVAFAIGGAAALEELGSAYEKKRLYRALIDPDLVLSHAEVEAGLFVAWFGVVLSLIPEAGTAVKGLVAGGKAVVKGEARALGKAAAKAVAARVAKEIAEFAVKDLLSAFIKEAVLNVVIDQVIQQAMAPMIEYIQHEASIGHGGEGQDRDASQADPDEQDFIDMIRAVEEP